MILIRQVDQAENTEERYENAFRGISKAKWAAVEDLDDFPRAFPQTDSAELIDEPEETIVVGRSNFRRFSLRIHVITIFILFNFS